MTEATARAIPQSDPATALVSNLMRLAVLAADGEMGDDRRALKAAAALTGQTTEECARRWAAEGRRARDKMLREVAAAFFPKVDKATAARRVESDMKRYMAGAWKEHQAALQRTFSPECPAELLGTMREHFWRQWTDYGPSIPAPDTIRRIISLTAPRTL